MRDQQEARENQPIDWDDERERQFRQKYTEQRCAILKAIVYKVQNLSNSILHTFINFIKNVHRFRGMSTFNFQKATITRGELGRISGGRGISGKDKADTGNFLYYLMDKDSSTV